MIHTILKFALLFSIVGFDQSQYKNNKKEFFSIKYEELLKCKNRMTLSQIALDVKYVKLETNSNIVIDGSAEYFFCDSLIFVKQKDHIYKFSSDGRFLKQIGSPGRGPGEISHIWTMSILPEKQLVVIYEAGNKKLKYFSFNGNLIKSISFPQFLNVKVLNDGRFIAQDQGIVESEEFTFLLLNENGDTSSYVRNYLKWKNNSGIIRMTNIPSFKPFYTYNRNYFFKTLYNDTVYSVDRNMIIPQYYIDMGMYKLPAKLQIDRTSQDVKTFQSNASKYYYVRVFEAAERIFVVARGWVKGSTNYIVNKNKFIRTSSYESSVIDGVLYNDWDGGYFFVPEGNVNDNSVFMPLQAITLRNYFDENKDIDIIAKYQEKQKYLSDLVSDLSISDNPVLMIVTLKPAEN